MNNSESSPDTMPPEPEDLDLTQVLNEIQSLPGDSLIERMLSWCEENTYDPMELGEMFSSSKQFKRVLWIDAVEHNQVQDNQVKDLLHETKELDVW